MDPDNRFGVNKNGHGLGLRFGIPVSENWDFQFGGSSVRARQNGNSVRQDLLGVDALYLFSRQAFRPFFVLGAGSERDRVHLNGIGDTSRTSPYIDAGLGFQYGFSNRWAMQADLRSAHGFLHGKTLGFHRSNTNYLNVGLIYAFDKSAEPVLPIAALAAPVAEPMRAPIPTPAPNPAPRFEKMTLLATELFEFNRAELRMPQTKLDEIASALRGDEQNSNVVISGYTDRIGPDGYNLKLSIGAPMPLKATWLAKEFLQPTCRRLEKVKLILL